MRPEPLLPASLSTIAAEAASKGVDTEGFLDDLTLAFASGRPERFLAPDVARAARALAAELERLTKTGGEPALPARTFDGTTGAILLAWAESAAARSDVVIASLLELALRAHQAPSRLIRAARARVLSGPLFDALRCIPLAGDPEWIFDDPAARARIDLLVWEAGAAALSIPRLGTWLFSSEARFDRFALQPSQGSLRDRVVAARFLQIAADGFPEETDAARGIRTARITRDLASHPEPLVWVPAALAMGRLSAKSRDVRSLLFRWIESGNVGERRRATTALAAMPGPESWWLDQRLAEVFKDDDPWSVAALGPAIPYLAVERRELWLDLSRRVASEEAGPEMLWSVTQGLLALARRGQMDRETSAMLDRARRRAIQERARSTAEAQLYDDIRRHTDFLDSIDPDPNDLELAFHRIVSAAVRIGADKVASRTHGLMRTLMPAFEAATVRLERELGDPADVASALATVESCARSAALQLWIPILRAAGHAEDPLEGQLAGGLERIKKRVADLLEGDCADFARHRTALRVLGSVTDAAPDRGETAAYVSAALERPAWLASLDKREASRLQKPLGDLLWRAVEASRHPDRPVSGPVLFARFAAWWALAARRAELLQFLARSDAARTRVSAEVFETVERIRARLAAPEGAWTAAVHEMLEELHAGDTALASALTSFGAALAQVERAQRVRGKTASTVALLSLADAASELGPLIQNPQLALGPEGDTPLDSTIRDLGQRTVSLLEHDHDSPIDDLAVPWSATLGPLLGPMAAKAVARLLASKRSSTPTTAQRRRIGGYRLEHRLGGGTQGEVWLVENDKNGRRFVMKLLTASCRTPAERDELKLALQMEADILKQLYHPNVANFVDNGWDQDQPYLVMEYLVGCDLEQYLSAQTLTVEEAKPIVHDTASGLAALARFGLAHCDLKPGNVFLRLALPSDRKSFDPDIDRDPNQTPILGAVVIDFGVSRTMAVVADEPSQTLSGTIGYIAPEQADGAVHPKTDVYALAATVYRMLTGRSFFDHLETVGRRLIAHHTTMPFDDPEIRGRLAGQDRLIQLLSDASALDPDARPSVEEFAKRFAAL